MKEMYNLYGMKDVPDVIATNNEGKVIYTFTTLENYSHKIIVSKIGIPHSIITISDSLFAKEVYNFLENSTNEYINLYFRTTKRNKANGIDSDECWTCQRASLIDFHYGMACDEEPAVYSYVFRGDVISSCPEEKFKALERNIK